MHLTISRLRRLHEQPLYLNLPYSHQRSALLLRQDFQNSLKATLIMCLARTISYVCGHALFHHVHCSRVAIAQHLCQDEAMDTKVFAGVKPCRFCSNNLPWPVESATLSVYVPYRLQPRSSRDIVFDMVMKAESELRRARVSNVGQTPAAGSTHNVCQDTGDRNSYGRYVSAATSSAMPTYPADQSMTQNAFTAMHTGINNQQSDGQIYWISGL